MRAIRKLDEAPLSNIGEWHAHRAFNTRHSRVTAHTIASRSNRPSSLSHRVVLPQFVSSTHWLPLVQLPPMSHPLSPTHSLLFMHVESTLQPLLAWHWLPIEHRLAPQSVVWVHSVPPQSVEP
jgi:hypothetical protein